MGQSSDWAAAGAVQGRSTEMFKIKYENLDRVWQVNISVACTMVERLSFLALKFTRAKTIASMVAWFGEDADSNPGLRENILRMHAVIIDTTRTVTFVNALGTQLRVHYNPDNILQSPVPIAPTPVKEMEGYYAWVFPLGMQAFPSGKMLTKKDPLAHAGSGMRLYLGYQTLMAPRVDDLDLIQSIYHELTHKVLATNDHDYGEEPCKSLISDGRALENADNYGFFLIHLT
jgi:hypothetical protein